jgi:phage gpG-like protein
VIRVDVAGLREVEEALRQAELRVRAATRKATDEAVKLARRRAHGELSRFQHARGTPTPSPAGSPPAWISGALRGSLKPTGPIPTGSGFLGRLGPTTVYARIQELGGVTGRNHATTLPPRPYMRPTYERMVADGSLRAVYVAAWRRAL